MTSPLSSPAFWRALDARVRRVVGELGRPLRGVLSRAQSAAGLMGNVSLREAEDVADVEVAQPWGFASAPVDGECIVLPIGSAGHLVVVGSLDKSGRPALQDGEAAIYASSGAQVILKSNGDVEVTPAAGRSVILAGGGAPVARVGDEVQIVGTVTTTAALGTWDIVATAYIVEGSAVVEAG